MPIPWNTKRVNHISYTGPENLARKHEYRKKLFWIALQFRTLFYISWSLNL